VKLIQADCENGDLEELLKYNDKIEAESEFELIDYHMTDAGNAEYFTLLYGDTIRYDHRRNRWLHWQKHYWKPETDGRIIRLALQSVRTRFKAIAGLDNPELKEKIAKWCIGSEQRGRLEACLAIAKNLKPIADAGEQWDKDNWLFCVKNGVVDLRTGELRPGKQEDMITMQSPVVYDPETKAPRWIQFLDEIFSSDAELIAYQQRYYGYCLTGDTREQTIGISHGKGANGKTRLLSILRHTFGDYAYDAPFSTFELNQRATIPNDLAALVNKRLVTSSETNEGTRLNEARIKALSGQDSITARFLHCEFFTFEPVAKFLLAVNHRPRVQDDSYGFWRRVRLIPFNREFKGKADDKQLGGKLLAEASGILNWLIKGCLAWQKQGLEPTPDCVLQATEEYRSESDLLAQFILDELVIHPQAQVKASVFYKAYTVWAEDQGLQKREIMTNTAFGRRMTQKFKKIQNRNGIFYQGVGMKCEGFVNSFISTEKNNEVNPHVNSLTRDNIGNPSQPLTTRKTLNKPLTQVKDPQKPCPVCGGTAYWMNSAGRYVCCRCHPEPGEKEE